MSGVEIDAVDVAVVFCLISGCILSIREVWRWSHGPSNIITNDFPVPALLLAGLLALTFFRLWRENHMGGGVWWLTGAITLSIIHLYLLFRPRMNADEHRAREKERRIKKLDAEQRARRMKELRR